MSEKYPPVRRNGARPSSLAAMADANTPSQRKPLVDPSRTARKPGRINLKAVGEVLAARGLDPTEALIDILDSGRLPADIQARILNELLQYTQPKLKSIEVRARVAATSFDVSDEQGKRIAEEFLRSGGYDPVADTTLE